MLEGGVGFKGLEKVGKGGLVVFFVALKRAGQLVNVGLDGGHQVDGGRGGAGGGEGGLGLGEVAQRVVDARLDQVDLHEQLLVVELLDLTNEPAHEREGGVKLGLLQQPALDGAREGVARYESHGVGERTGPGRRGARAQGGLAGLKALAEEGALLLTAPRDAFPAQAQLKVRRSLHLGHLVQKVPHCAAARTEGQATTPAAGPRPRTDLGRPGLGNRAKEGLAGVQQARKLLAAPAAGG